jgi:hypothetical protein
METQQNQSKLNPAFFFISLGALVSLIASVASFLNLVFETLNQKFPDVLNATYQYGYNTYNFEGMRMALATLIIFFPVFLVLSHYWRKMIGKGLGHTDEIIRKWMVYILIFLSSIVILVDLVTLVKYFVSGEITLRFILKILVTLAVAKWTLLYYLYQLRDSKWKKIVDSMAPWVASVLAVAAIVFAFTVMGSPFKQRQLRLDDRRIQDLQTIQYQVINFWQQKEKLPEKLADLANPLSGFSIPVDPEFEKGIVYEYNKKSDLTFELCSTFTLPIPKGWQENNYLGYKGGIMPMAEPARDVATSAIYPYPGEGSNESWDHEAGRTCFERTIDKDMYPPFPKPEPMK